MKTQTASKYAFKFFTIGKNWPVFLLAAFLLIGCPSDSGEGGDTVPVTPANPGAAGGDQRVTVIWDSAAGASSYNVYWSTTSGTGTGGTLENVSAPPFYHDGVTNDTPYYYVVTAVNDAGESGSSSQVTAIPDDIFLSGLSFANTNLSVCIDALGLIYVHDLTSLNCIFDSIDNIGGIEALTSLMVLRLNNNTITDISPLASLTGLTLLHLNNNNTITDVSPLAGLTSLTELNLGNNTITDVNSLAGLTGLTELHLYMNTITDVSPLEGLTGLTNLYLYMNTITDVSPLAGLTSLTDLDLGSNTYITDVTPLAGLTSLTRLILYSNTITDVSPLEGLASLTFLALRDNTIIDVSPLAGLTSLTVLGLGINSIGGQGVGNVDDLTALISATAIYLSYNIGMSCAELGTLITELGSPPVDTDDNIETTDTATDGENCTNL